MWKTVLLVVCVALAGLIVWTLWTQHQRTKAVVAEAVMLLAQRDSALARAEAADSASAVIAREVARLDSLRLMEKEEAARRARALAAKADKLTEEISALMPPELVDVEIQEAVMDAVMDLRMTYEERITDLTNLLTMTEATLERSRAQVERDERVKVSLRMALALETERADMWEREANPGFFGGLWKEKGPLSAVLTLGLVGGAALGG